MSPGSQTFEQALFKLFMEGEITQEEAMANSDSATNMLWLINQATASNITATASADTVTPAKPDEPEKKEGILASAGNASFSEIKIDIST